MRPDAARAQGQGDGRPAGARSARSAPLSAPARPESPAPGPSELAAGGSLRAACGRRSENSQSAAGASATTLGMQLDPAVCYRALRARDARFDGRFFIAVRTTGIYCRPVCPAPTAAARELHCSCPCAAAAEEAGFRPCLRCRPETVARHAGLARQLGDGVARAALIEAGALDDAGVDALAATARCRRPAPAPALRAAPRRVAARGRRDAPLALREAADRPDVAAAWRRSRSRPASRACAASTTRCAPPTGVRRARCGARRAGGAAAERATLELRLGYRPPYAWDDLLAFLAARAIPGVECVSDGALPAHASGKATAVGLARGPSPAARSHQLARAASRRRGALRLIDLAPPPARALRPRRGPGRDRRRSCATTRPCAARCARRPGMRVPGALDGFELAVRAILGQQVSVAAATRLAGRLVEQFGAKLPDTCVPRRRRTPAADATSSRRAERLADADVAAIGMPARARRRDPRARARGGRGRLHLEPDADPDREHATRCCTSRCRRVDGRLHRDARAARARRLSGRRSRDCVARSGSAVRSWRHAPRPGDPGAPTPPCCSGSTHPTRCPESAPVDRRVKLRPNRFVEGAA